MLSFIGDLKYSMIDEEHMETFKKVTIGVLCEEALHILIQILVIIEYLNKYKHQMFPSNQIMRVQNSNRVPEGDVNFNRMMLMTYD